MNNELMRHLMKIEKMLFMLLDEEQKNEINKDDIDYYELQIRLYNNLLEKEEKK